MPAPANEPMLQLPCSPDMSARRPSAFDGDGLGVHGDVEGALERAPREQRAEQAPAGCR